MEVPFALLHVVLFLPLFQMPAMLLVFILAKILDKWEWGL